MGDCYPPTVADYAMSAAQDAQKKNASQAAILLRLVAAIKLLAEGDADNCCRELEKLEAELRRP
jgi:hypothetical protein